MKTVIFDFDGTLANTIELVARLYNEHAESFGSRQVSLSELPEYRKLGYKGAMKKAGIRWTSLPRLVLLISREMKQHMGEVQVYDGMVELVHDLRKDGIKIGVLTSNNAALVHDFFEARGFPEFDFIVSEKTMFGKEKALRRIIRRHKLNPSETIYVGDEPRDVTGSHKAGIKVIGVTWGFGGKEGFEIAKPDMIANSATELKVLLEK